MNEMTSREAVDQLSEAELYQRVADDDPNRCQANNAHGQCSIRAIPGLKYCRMHAAASAHHQRNQDANMYRLGRWQRRVQELGTSDKVKSLRDEIGILRMLLEERFSKINDTTDLLIQSHTISDMVLKVERVVTACHKIEKSMGDLLDKSEITRFADMVVSIIEDVLSDSPEKVKEISKRMDAALTMEDDNEDA